MYLLLDHLLMVIQNFIGEFLINAQGEDVVSGTRTLYTIQESAQIMPNVYVILLKQSFCRL